MTWHDQSQEYSTVPHSIDRDDGRWVKKNDGRLLRSKHRQMTDSEEVQLTTVLGIDG